jgi:hypothetical protein
VLAIVYLAVVGFIFWRTFSNIDKPAVSAIITALVGSLGLVVGAALSGVVTLWSRSSEDEQRLKDQASRQALELTRLYYELKEKELASTKSTVSVLSPIKVYRELYRALLQLIARASGPRSSKSLAS